MIVHCGQIERFRGNWDILHPSGLVPDTDVLHKNAGWAPGMDSENRDAQIARGALELLQNLQAHPETFAMTNATLKQHHQQLLKYSQRDAEHRGRYRTSLDENMQELFKTTKGLLQSPDRHILITIAFFRATFIKIMPFMAANAQLVNIMSYLLLLQNGYAFVSQFPLIAALSDPPETASKNPICLLPEMLAELTRIYKHTGKIPTNSIYINPRRQSLIICIRDYAPLKISDIMTHFPNDSRNTIKKDLLFLRENSLIGITGKGRGMVYLVTGNG